MASELTSKIRNCLMKWVKEQMESREREGIGFKEMPTIDVVRGKAVELGMDPRKVGFYSYAELVGIKKKGRKSIWEKLTLAQIMEEILVLLEKMRVLKDAGIGNKDPRMKALRCSLRYRGWKGSVGKSLVSEHGMDPDRARRVKEKVQYKKRERNAIRAIKAGKLKIDD